MKHFLFKLGLFFCIWYEIAAELHLSGNAALAWGIAAWCGCWLGVRLAAHALGLMGPGPFGVLVQVIAWLILYFWIAPKELARQPWTIVVAAVLAAAVGGAVIRWLVERDRRRHGKGFWYRHSVSAVLLMFSALGMWAFSLRYWGSVWPLVGYSLLLILPLNFGWRRVHAARPDSADARFGDPRTYRDAGVSEDR